MTPLLLLAAITFHVDFEAGSLGKVETVSPGHYRCHVLGEVDQDKRNRQASWYFFRIDGAQGQPLTLDLVDLPGEYNYKPNQGAIIAETVPFYSEDEKTWRQVEIAEFDRAVPLLRIRLTPKTRRIWIAHQPPYTNRDLARLVKDLHVNPFLRGETIGKSVQGRDLLLFTITDPPTPDRGKKVIWMMFRQHSWESGSSWAAEGAVRFLTGSSAAAAALRRATIYKIFPLCDPDGVARGGVRFNAHGYDLNRNWDRVDERTMPEIAAQRRAVLAWVDSGHPVDLFVTLHNDEQPEYVDGPPGEEYLGLLQRFESLLSRSAAFSPTRPAALAPLSTTEGKPGRMAVYQGLYYDRKIPAFLIELRIVRHPKLGRQPNSGDRLQFGADLARAASAAVNP